MSSPNNGTKNNGHIPPISSSLDTHYKHSPPIQILESYLLFSPDSPADKPPQQASVGSSVVAQPSAVSSNTSSNGMPNLNNMLTRLLSFLFSVYTILQICIGSTVSSLTQSLASINFSSQSTIKVMLIPKLPRIPLFPFNTFPHLIVILNSTHSFIKHVGQLPLPPTIPRVVPPSITGAGKVSAKNKGKAPASSTPCSPATQRPPSPPGPSGAAPLVIPASAPPPTQGASPSSLVPPSAASTLSVPSSVATTAPFVASPLPASSLVTTTALHTTSTLSAPSSVATTASLATFTPAPSVRAVRASPAPSGVSPQTTLLASTRIVSPPLSPSDLEEIFSMSPLSTRPTTTASPLTAGTNAVSSLWTSPSVGDHVAFPPLIQPTPTSASISPVFIRASQLLPNSNNIPLGDVNSPFRPPRPSASTLHPPTNNKRNRVGYDLYDESLTPDSPPLSPDYTPGGSELDADDTSLISIVENKEVFRVTLDNIGTLTIEMINQELVNNHLPLFNDYHFTAQVRVVLMYFVEEDQIMVQGHNWRWGDIYFNPFNEDTTRYGRIMFTTVNFKPADASRTITFLARRDIMVLHIRATKRPGMVSFYYKSSGDWTKAINYRECNGCVIVPASRSEESVITFSPVLVLSRNNYTDHHRLHINNIPVGTVVDKLLGCLKLKAGGAGFNENDVITVVVHTLRGTNRTGRFGFVFVRNEDLARFFLRSPLHSQQGTMNMSIPVDNDRTENLPSSSSSNPGGNNNNGSNNNNNRQNNNGKRGRDSQYPNLPLPTPLSNKKSCLKITSINANGKFYSHLAKFVKLMIDNNIDILMVQHTGSIKSKYEATRLGFKIIDSVHIKQDPAGSLAFVLHSTIHDFFTVLDNDCKIDNKSLPFTINNRLMLARITYPIEAYIINAYCQKGNPTNFENIKNIPSLIMAGDFNSYVNSSLDAFSSKTNPKRQPRPVEAILNNNYKDIFRILNPERRKFSRFGYSKDQDTGIQHTSASRIDYFFISTSWLNFIEDIHIDNEEDNTFNSDHRAITLTIQSEEIPPYLNEEPFMIRSHTKDKKRWNKEFSNLINNKIDKLLPGPVIPPSNKEEIESNTDKISEAISASLDELFPQKIVFPSDMDSILDPDKSDPKIIELRKYRITAQKALKIVTNSPNYNLSPELDHLINELNINVCHETYRIQLTNNKSELLANLHSTENHLDNKIHRILQSAKRTRIRKIVNDKLNNIKDEPGKLFTLFRTPRRKKIEMVSKIVDGKIKLLYDTNMVSEISQNWEKTFSNKVPPSSLDTFLKNMPSLDPNTNIAMPDFSIENIKKIIKEKKSTAPGPSRTSWKSLKKVPDKIINLLSTNYRAIYEQGYIPTKWKKGNTLLLEKPTKDVGLDKFRPITLLSVEYKLYSHILNEAVIKSLIAGNIIPASQNGFVPDRGSDQCLHTLINIIHNAKCNNKELYCLFIDYAKAFDSVEHWVIEKILNHINIGKLGTAVMETLKNGITCIETGQGWTDPINFFRGTKQGDIISPIIFVLFIAPLLWTLDKSKKSYNILTENIPALAIADDIAILSDNRQNIEYLYSLIEHYSRITGMDIKPGKSAAAYRGSSGFILSVNGTGFRNLGSTGSYPYLGVWINLELDWTTQMNNSFDTLKDSIDLIMNKYYLSCNQHIKLINLIPIAALQYRMQFIIFPSDWLTKIQKWIILRLSQTHSLLAYSANIEFWCSFKSLLNLISLNAAVYISNVHKNLNKPKAIAYNILHKLAGFDLNGDSIIRNHHPTQSILIAKRILQHIKTNFLFSPYFENIAHSLATPNHNNLLNPQLLYDLEQSTLTTIKDNMIKLPSPPPTTPIYSGTLPPIIVAFVDGSFDPQSLKMAFALKNSLNPNNILVKTVHGPFNSTEPELQVIEYTILDAPPNIPIIIFTDSKSAINLLINFDSLNTNGD